MKIFFTLFISLIYSLSILYADNGDTIVVQTIDYNTPVLPGWNSPRSGTYLFPPDSISFSKILMSYNLKCDPSQSPACGEWDYTTHTKIMEHTGVFDSTLYFYPNYIVNNQSPDSFMMMFTPSFSYIPILEYSNQTMPTNSAEPGNNLANISIPFNEYSVDGRSQFIYSASELQNAGLQVGDITGMQLNIVSGSVELSHLTFRLSHYNKNVLPVNEFVEDGLVNVYSSNSILSATSSQINFAFPFSWDGSQNIIVDISYAGHNGAITMGADETNTGESIISGSKDYFLDFKGWDFIDLPKEVFNTVDSAITISFWQYGNSDIQPINSSIFEAIDSLGNRVLNAHLPWSNGKVYWDAGFDGPDRIFRQASTHEYEGQWNFWTFIKDARSGSMQILLNGNLWFVGSGRTKPIINIEKFRIGAALTFDGYYAGMIDDFRIWDTILAWDDISNWMYKDIDASHPMYNHLVAYYRFNTGDGVQTIDDSQNNYIGTQFGYPGWKNYQGRSIFRNSMENNSRPHLILENGNYNFSNLDSLVVVDTVEQTPVNIILIDPDNPPAHMDTITRWPSYYDNYVFNDGGIAIDSTFVQPDEIIYLNEMPYYGTPFELLIPWEIGRFITPYGNNLTLGNDGFTWVYDVTDYVTLLSDSVHITAGNFQELLDLEFHMIEGTPPRDVLKLEKIYSGYWYLSDFEEKVVPDTVALLANAQSFKVKTRTTGHLFDNPTNCAEFCNKLQSFDVNGTMIKEWEIIQECSDNPLYPQGGTWIYDRAGWCPGMKVTEQDIEITPFINNDTVILDYNTQYDQYGTYSLEAHLFSYGYANFTLDAAVEEIIAPSKLKRYARFNPTASTPIIVISNLGHDTLTSLDITYGPLGAEKTMSWTGQLPFTKKEEVTLEAFDWEEWVIGDGNFSVSISNPNGGSDENNINDSYYSQYELPVVYPSTIVIHLKTNKAAYQNSYEILSNTGTQLFVKDDFENQTLYIDTLTFLNGCYDFYLHDTGDNGIAFWANNEGSGSLKFYDINGNMLKNFNGDFGDRIYQSFYADMYLDIAPNPSQNIAFDIIPNPNNGNFIISYALENESEANIIIYNSTGQIIHRSNNQNAINNKIEMSLGFLPDGIYTCSMVSRNETISKKFIISR